MSFEQKDFSGSLFKNQKREKQTHPNATGKAMIGGVLYYVSAWTKEDKNGKPWQSLSFTKVYEKAPTGERIFPKKTTEAPGFDDMPDDIPF
jgi:hypothetical protein